MPRTGLPLRKAALLASGLFLIGPLAWFIPPMVARIVHPDLQRHVSRPEKPGGRGVCIRRDGQHARGDAGPAHQRHLRGHHVQHGRGPEQERGIFRKETFTRSCCGRWLRTGSCLLVSKLATFILGILVIMTRPLAVQHLGYRLVQPDEQFRRAHRLAVLRPAHLGHAHQARAGLGGLEPRSWWDLPRR